MNKNFLFFTTSLLLSTALSVPTAAADTVNTYDELRNAISAGGEYSLTANLDGNESLGTATGNFTLDGNGFGIKGSNGITGMVIDAGATVVLKNIGNTESNSWEGFSHNISNQGSLALDNVYFRNNHTEEAGFIDGGIISNAKLIKEISNSFFDGNYSASNTTATWGGIIANGNYADSTKEQDVTIERIYNTTFSNNYIETLAPSIAASHGGIIVNYGKIGTVEKATFENNTMTAAENSWGGNHGAAIDNQDHGSINLITDSVFRNNKTFRTGDTVYDDGRNYHASAGAIDNYGTIGLIKNSIFENNSAESVASNAGSGAIMSISTTEEGGYLGGIENSSFIANHSYSQKMRASAGALSSGRGAGVDKLGVIDHITDSKFIGNYAKSDENYAYGGAVYNNNMINLIQNVVFDGNYVLSGLKDSNQLAAYGGGLLNSGVIKNLSAEFTNNYVKNEVGDSSPSAGAIFNSGDIGDFDADGNYVSGGINGSFIGNYAVSTLKNVTAGAIENRGKIGAVSVNFSNNYAQGKTQAVGGAVVNSGSLESLSVVVDNNYALSTVGSALGGGISNKGKIGNVFGSFSGNYAKGGTFARGGVIYSANGGNIGGIVNSEFIGNYAEGEGSSNSSGGAVDNRGSLSKLETVLFSGNSVTTLQSGALGGALYNHNTGTVGSVSTVNFSGNYAKGGTYARGGAIYNQGTLPALVNSSFIGNYVEASDSGEEKSAGGAIYSTTDLTISALNGDSLFSGNYVKAGGVERGNDIYLAGTGDSPLNLNLTADNGSLSLNSGIDGNGYSIALSGDASGTINFGGLISNASEVVSSDVTVNFNKGQEGLVYNQQSGTANLNAAFNNSSLTVGEAVAGISSKTAATTVMNVADGSYLNGNNSLTVNSGMVNIGNLDNNLHFNKLSMTGGSLAIESVGVDLATQVMGSLSADSYDHQSGTIAVKNVNVTADGSAGTTAVNFTDSLIADKVVSGIKESLGPVWKYDVAYNSQTGEFEFSRPETPGGDDVNPEVMAPVVAAASTVAVLNDEIYSRVLGDVDVLGRSTPHVSSSDRSIKNAWVKTFGSKDSVDLKNFRGADTKFYGFIGGLSSDRINEGQGWSAIYSVYGAYAGGEQKFAGEKVTNNGGYLGLGASFYNGDFFIGATVNGGLIRNRSDKTGVDGKDKFNSYVGGIAAKSGYDYHIGSFTVEPNVYASYTVIGADDYMTKSGVKVDFGTMSVIEAAPGLKLAQEFGEGLKGYVSGRYVWTFTEGDHVKANQFDLPDVELEDYAEYGIGLEKNWDASSGFVEVKRRDGGRNGWNFTAGYKSAF